MAHRLRAMSAAPSRPQQNPLQGKTESASNAPVREHAHTRMTTLTQPNTTCNYRFSGHETFPCRYTWLPKAVARLQAKPTLFADEDDAMVQLGVGKNMARAIRF